MSFHLHIKSKKKSATRQAGAAESKRKEIKSVNKPWELKPKRKVNSRINDQIKKSLYNWIMNHPPVLQSPILNYCLKLNIDSHTEPKLVPKLLLNLYVQ